MVMGLGPGWGPGWDLRLGTCLGSGSCHGVGVLMGSRWGGVAWHRGNSYAQWASVYRYTQWLLTGVGSSHPGSPFNSRTNANGRAGQCDTSVASNYRPADLHRLRLKGGNVGNYRPGNTRHIHTLRHSTVKSEISVHIVQAE